MSEETIIAAAVGVILGGLITWLAAWYYYKKAGDELLAESKKLKLTSDLVLYKLQHPEAPTHRIRRLVGFQACIVSHLDHSSRLLAVQFILISAESASIAAKFL
jgi:peptidoglycan biosynthesis protein MviN/MurJ (putative lipid II flippase)